MRRIRARLRRGPCRRNVDSPLLHNFSRLHASDLHSRDESFTVWSSGQLDSTSVPRNREGELPTYDIVIKGGTVIDGLQTPRYKTDVGIAGGKIAQIGAINARDGADVVDASGKVVAPGVVDLHTHYDSQLFWDPWCTMSGWHGVTSVVIGNCGFGFAPCKPQDRDRAMLSLSRNEAVPLKTMQVGMPWDWVTFAEFLDSVERTPKGVNVMSFVPLAPLYG